MGGGQGLYSTEVAFLLLILGWVRQMILCQVTSGQNKILENILLEIRNFKMDP